MLKKICLVSSLLALSACVNQNSNLLTFTQGDIQTATNLANAVGDTQDAACWPVIGSAVNALNGNVGIATVIQGKISVGYIANNPACAALTIKILTEGLKLSNPFVGIALP